MILTVRWTGPDGDRRPDVPPGASWTLLRDHGDTCDVRILGEVTTEMEQELERLRIQHADWPARVAHVRWQREQGGTVWQGHRVRTDTNSQFKLFAEFSMLNQFGGTVQWKFADSWASLDAEAMGALVLHVRDHIQACFAREHDLQMEGPETGDLAAGWPPGWDT